MSGLEIIDVSVTIRPGMPVYEGDPEVRLARVSSLEEGDPATVSRLDLGVHTGTHVDAPNHFLPGAPGVESLPLDVLVGPAQVVDATGVGGPLDAAALARLDLREGVDRLLFRTTNSRLWERDEFVPTAVDVTADGADALLERGVRLVGIDYLSVGDEETHRRLLRAGVVILEGLDLREVRPGSYRLVCLPLKLAGSDGAPARTVLLRG